MAARIEHIRIGGVGIQVTWDSRLTTAYPLGPLLGPFVDQDGVPDLRLRVLPADGVALPHGECLVDSFPDWRLWSTPQGRLYEVFEQRAPHHRLQWALLDAAGHTGTIWLERGEAHLGWLTRPLLQLMLLEHWADHQTQLVHGVAVDDGGVGRVFIGASGTGKSTLGGWYQAAGATVLSDEHIVLQLRDGQLVAYGTPWPGTSGQSTAGSVRVASVCFLAHASQHALEPLAPKEVLAVLHPQLFLTHAAPHQLLRVLAWCERLAQAVPVARLHFTRDPNVLEFVRTHLTSAAPVGALPEGVVHA